MNQNDFLKDKHSLRVLAWETTRSCTLACPHCRASAVEHRDHDELTTIEAMKMLTSASEVGSAIVILSGGEPLLREDLEEIAEHAIKCRHRPVVSCNDGSLLTYERIASLKKSGIKHFSFSMHSNNRMTHDAFVRKTGAFEDALKAFGRIRQAGLSFQINTTVLPQNHESLEAIKDWVVSLKASAWHLFFIVPTGRATSNLKEVSLTSEQQDKVLTWLAANSDSWEIPIKVTCAPQYARIRAQMGFATSARGRSCMAGSGFVFVDYKGNVKPCGYFSLEVGNIRKESLASIYKYNEDLLMMRESANLKGVCQTCTFNDTCGGCRARAYATTGDYLQEDPACIYSSGVL